MPFMGENNLVLRSKDFAARESDAGGLRQTRVPSQTWAQSASGPFSSAEMFTSVRKLILAATLPGSGSFAISAEPV
jgi:hypothetical protein